VVTYEELILSRELPESIIIAGAGAIGIEFGYVLKKLRRRRDHRRIPAAGRCPPKDVEGLKGNRESKFKKLGVKILTGTKVEVDRRRRFRGHGDREQGR